MYHLPGLSHRATAVVIERAEQAFPDWDKPVGRPRSLSLLQALKLTLCRLRRNATYQDLHEDFEIGRITAWEYDQTMVEFLAREFGYPDDEDREKLLAMVLEGTVCLIDGTLVPTFNWKHRTDLLSGKHRRHGVTIQLFVDLHGRLICASLAFPGSWHDIHCFREAGWVDVVAHAGGGRGIGDLGYEGEREAVSTPIKKKPKKDLTDAEKDINTIFAKIRVPVEWGVGHLKNWRILATRYRSDLARIDTDIQAAIEPFPATFRCIP
ncbi:transposase [Frankia sp. Cj3]|uniref:transposase n=1 Tax=Frankia sp. Cj3 TaxID=2880976 RepID=UPI002106C864|nr:transposase [Frankia sp. Cj3]